MNKDQILDLLSGAGAIRRQSRGRSCRVDRLFRQGAEAALISESAMLVALPQSPETRRLDRYPEVARARVTAFSIAWWKRAACR